MEEWLSTRPVVIGGTSTVDEEEQHKLDLTIEFYRNKVRDAIQLVHEKLMTAIPTTNNSTGRMRSEFFKQFEQSMSNPEKAKLML